MFPFFFRVRFRDVLDALKHHSRAKRRRLGARRFLGSDSLEQRALLADITASAVITSAPDGPNFDYTIGLTNSSVSNAGIGTFWYAWLPGEEFLHTSPLSVTPPTGWTDTITQPVGLYDGYAIEFTANSSASYVQPGASMNFMFKSADTPALINGNAEFHPGTPVGRSVVYPAGPFSDAGHEFDVMPPPPPPPPSTPPALVGMNEVSIIQNKKHQVTQIIIVFSGGVNVSEADTVATYRLVMPGKKGSFVAKNAKVIALRSAVFDAAHNAVTLTPRKPFSLSKPIQLVVNGQSPSGLEDSAGRLIDGDHDGQAGGNGVAVLRRGGAKLSAVLSTLSSGQPAVQEHNTATLTRIRRWSST
jgi:hypothetical protein